MAGGNFWRVASQLSGYRQISRGLCPIPRLVFLLVRKLFQ
jgi:hypothetical protein